ncbi:NAD(+) diphosphatase [Octadecabacter sp. R77987]|uniref:NAD(+) diphosphatase n=1 Tax=Octadecabacter sp. R77987 TaxID=3093874 RepID=UPI00366F721E
MRHAETVTFGGAALDRAGQVRGDIAALDRMRAHKSARAILMWRGKPLVHGNGALALVPMTHAAMADAAADQVFLGRENGVAIFAADLSAWAPDDLDDSTLNQFLDPSEQRHPALPDDHRFAELRAVMTGLTPREAELAAMARAVFQWHLSHRFCACCGAASVMAMAGWQRDCPSCGAHHFPRTDPVVIMLITQGNSVLMGRSPGWPEGMYSLLAGFVEPGETIEAAVRREVFEESGVRVGPVSYLASQPWPFPASLMFGCHGEALSHDITVDPTEIEDALWVTREELLQVFAGRHPLINPARNGAIAHFLLRNWLADSLD